MRCACPSLALGGVAERVKLFVGQLPGATDEPILRELFEPFGSVADVVCRIAVVCVRASPVTATLHRKLALYLDSEIVCRSFCGTSLRSSLRGQVWTPGALFTHVDSYMRVAAFVVMSNRREALAAIEALHQRHSLSGDGNKMTVSIAHGCGQVD